MINSIKSNFYWFTWSMQGHLMERKKLEFLKSEKNNPQLSGRYQINKIVGLAVVGLKSFCNKGEFRLLTILSASGNRNS